MSQVADDLSVAWYQACDQIRSQLPALAANHSVWLLPSLESALFEISQVLIDRNSEMGGAKNKALFIKGQDPAFEVLGSQLSASGLDARFCSIDEFQSPASVFDSIKSELLFSAFASSSRFTGEAFDFAAARAHMLGAGSKAAIIQVEFEQLDAKRLKPEPWEIVLHVLWSGATLVTLGERFRVSPKFAPFQMPRTLLSKVVEEFTDTIGSPSGLDDERDVARRSIEDFEAKLSKPFRSLHATGAKRVLDRVIFYSEELDGSWVCETLGAEVLNSVADGKALDVATTSGCWDAEAPLKRADERRQDWLRNNRRVWSDQRAIRGMVQIPLRTVKRLTSEKLLELLQLVASSHK